MNGPSAAPSNRPAPPSLCVSVVEDDALFRDLLAIGLEPQPGIEVAGVYPDGESALTAIPTDPPGVLIVACARERSPLSTSPAHGAVAAHVPPACVSVFAAAALTSTMSPVNPVLVKSPPPVGV
jgi:DNA-binding NarL/FixJ family response regulator